MKKLLIILAVIVFLMGTGFAYGNAAFESSVLGSIDVNIDGENSVVKVMGNVHIPEGRVIQDDVVAVMGNVKIDGTVKGDVIAVMGNVTVDGEVGGDAVAVMGNLKVNNVVAGDGVSVMGNIQKGPQGKIGGEFVEASGPNINIFAENDFPAKPFGGFPLSLKIFNAILLFGLASLVLGLMPVHTKNMVESLGSDPWRKLLVGFVSLIVFPLVAIIALVSILGIPLVPFIILAFVVGKFIGYVAVALFVGNRIQNAASLNLNLFIQLLFGVILLWLIKLIPVIGFLSGMVVTLFALGLIIDTKFGTNRPWFRKKEYKM